MRDDRDGSLSCPSMCPAFSNIRREGARGMDREQPRGARAAGVGFLLDQGRGRDGLGCAAGNLVEGEAGVGAV